MIRAVSCPTRGHFTCISVLARRSAANWILGEISEELADLVVLPTPDVF